MIKKGLNSNFFKTYQDVIIPVIIVIVVILLSFILFLVANKTTDNTGEKDENKVKAITEKGVIKDEEFHGLKFTNTVLVKKGNIYTLSMDVKNTSKETVNVTSVDIPIKDKKGDEIITLLGYIGKELKPDEQVTIIASTSTDLSKAYTKEIAERK